MVLPPKPPPISVGMTLIMSVDSPSTFALNARTMNAPCVQHHTTERPSSPVRASTACGSM